MWVKLADLSQLHPLQNSCKVVSLFSFLTLSHWTPPHLENKNFTLIRASSRSWKTPWPTLLPVAKVGWWGNASSATGDWKRWGISRLLPSISDVCAKVVPTTAGVGPKSNEGMSNLYLHVLRLSIFPHNGLELCPGAFEEQIRNDFRHNYTSLDERSGVSSLTSMLTFCYSGQSFQLLSEAGCPQPGSHMMPRMRKPFAARGRW